MKHFKSFVLFAFLTMLILSGCNNIQVYTVKTDATKKLKTDLMGISSAIKNVKVEFIKPELYIDVYFKDSPIQQTIDDTLEKVKLFATIDTLDSIGPSVHFKDAPIWGVSLYIYINNNDHSPTYEYSTTYYGKDLPENIDGYQTWVQEK